MSVLIIGDSFADPKTWNYENNPHAWTNRLSEILECEVTAVGISGCSLEFTYHQFINNYDSSVHDTIIFIRTNTNRRWLTDNKEKHTLHYSTGSTIEKLDIAIPFQELRSIFKGYMLSDAIFKNSHDWKLEVITDAIKYKLHDDSNIIILDLIDMAKISNIDYTYHNITMGTVYENDRRPCHMNFKQNKKFAELMAAHIRKEINITDVFEDVNQYFDPADTYEETGFVKI